MLTDTQSNILNELQYCIGIDNVKTSKHFEGKYSLIGQEVRHTINSLRQKGYPICSCGNGYYYAKSHDDIIKTIQSLKHRVTGINNAIEGMYQSLNAI